MPERESRWVRVKPLTVKEKRAIAARCDRFIAEILMPRFLPRVIPTEFNYPVHFSGKWRGSKYSFITRYRSGYPDHIGQEFDSAFTRLDHVEEYLAGTRFDIMWHRHTGKWHCLYASVALEEALRLIVTEEVLVPF
ncbi:MAG: hypothetical protein JWL86_6234 [Rhizobium sp.]|nr:hypothetical protein [Rhizobium sp.]